MSRIFVATQTEFGSLKNPPSAIKEGVENDKSLLDLNSICPLFDFPQKKTTSISDDDDGRLHWSFHVAGSRHALCSGCNTLRLFKLHSCCQFWLIYIVRQIKFGQKHLYPTAVGSSNCRTDDGGGKWFL